VKERREQSCQRRKEEEAHREYASREGRQVAKTLTAGGSGPWQEKEQLGLSYAVRYWQDVDAEDGA